MDFYLETLIERTVKKTIKKKKTEVEEIVNDDGSIIGSKIPVDVNVKNMTAKKTTDDYVDMGRQPPTTGEKVNGPRTSRNYWGESDMTSVLGYEETMGKEKSYDEAKRYFTHDLGFDEVEAEERLSQLGYVKNANDKVRLIEDKEFFKQLIDGEEETRLNPIVLRQLKSLKQTLKSNQLSIQDILPYLDGE